MRVKNWHALALIFGVVWLVYYPALSAPLNPIDDVRMVNDLLNRTAFDWRDFVISTGQTYYRPLISNSFIVDRLLWNLEAPFLHLENVALHWLNCMLVYAVTRRFAAAMGMQSVGLPLLAALWFAVHPVNSEAVIWIAGRADMLATTFVLLTLYCALRYFATTQSVWLSAVALAFFAGCLAKETALFVWPGLLLLAWAWCRDRTQKDWPSLKNALFPAMACLPGMAGYFLLRAYALHGRDLGLRHVGQTAQLTAPSAEVSQAVARSGDVWSIVNTVFTATGFYARKMIQPLPLNFGIVQMPAYYFWGGIAVLLLAVWLLRRLTLPGALLLTSMSLASIALLVAMGGVSWTPLAERYMYAPTAVLCIALTTAAAHRLSGNGRLVSLSGGALLVLLLGAAVVTCQRAQLWTDNGRLFEDTVDKSPGFAMAKNQLAIIMFNRGERAAALEIFGSNEVPRGQAATLNRSLVLMEKGQYAEAGRYLRELLADPASSSYRMAVLKQLLAVTEQQAGKCADPDCRAAALGESAELLRKLYLQTRDPFYQYRLGQVLLYAGDQAAAQKSFAAAYEKLPESSLYKEPAGKLAARLKEP